MLTHALLVDVSGEIQAFVNSQLPGEFLQSFPIIAIACQREFEIVTSRTENPQAFEENRQPFFNRKTSDIEQLPDLLANIGIREAFDIDATTNDLQTVPIGLIREQHHLAATIMADTCDKARVAKLLPQRPMSRIEKDVRPVNGDAVTNPRQRTGQQGNGATVVATVVMHMRDTLPPQLER